MRQGCGNRASESRCRSGPCSGLIRRGLPGRGARAAGGAGPSWCLPGSPSEALDGQLSGSLGKQCLTKTGTIMISRSRSRAAGFSHMVWYCHASSLGSVV